MITSIFLCQVDHHYMRVKGVFNVRRYFCRLKVLRFSLIIYLLILDSHFNVWSCLPLMLEYIRFHGLIPEHSPVLLCCILKSLSSGPCVSHFPTGVVLALSNATRTSFTNMFN